MKESLKKLAKLAFGGYSIYHIYSSCEGSTKVIPEKPNEFLFTSVEKAEVQDNKERLIRDQAMYHGQEAYAYACMNGQEIIGLCYFWYGERYRERNFLPLADGEAKLVQIVTVPEMRGRGIAGGLISYAARDMAKKGFHRLYARIWHSNMPSLRAFESVGWRRVATVAELNPLRRRKPLRITLRTTMRAQQT
jgi:RimJ/RimL family protein N-acetyltransferase